MRAKSVKPIVLALVSVSIVLIATQPLLVLTNSGEIANVTTYRTITSTTYGTPSDALSSQDGIIRIGDIIAPNPSSSTWKFILPEFLPKVVGSSVTLDVDAYLFLRDNTPLASLDFFEGNPVDAARILTDSEGSLRLHNSVYGGESANLSVAWYDVTWSQDQTSHKYSYELYLDNDNEENNATVLYDDEESFWSAFQYGSGTYGISLSCEIAEVMKGSSSQKAEIGPGSYADLGVYHQFASRQDWSSYDFLCLWIYGANSSETLYISIKDADGNFRSWMATDNWGGWRRLVLPLNAPQAESENFDIAAIERLEAEFGNVGSTFTWHLDRTCLDVGKWAKVEAYVPDSITDYKIYSWNTETNSWTNPQFAWWGTTNDIDSGRMNFLSGDTIYDLYSSAPKGISIYPPAQQGETVVPAAGKGGPITYSDYFSNMKRIGFAIKIPSDDGQDTPDQGNSQCRLKFEVHYENPDDVIHDFFSDETLQLPIVQVSINGYLLLNTALRERKENHLTLSQEEYDLNAMVGSIGPLLRVEIEPDYLGVENILNITVDHHTSWNISYAMLRLIDSTRQLHLPFTQTLGIYSFLAFTLAYSPLMSIAIATTVVHARAYIRIKRAR